MAAVDWEIGCGYSRPASARMKQEAVDRQVSTFDKAVWMWAELIAETKAHIERIQRIYGREPDGQKRRGGRFIRGTQQQLSARARDSSTTCDGIVRRRVCSYQPVELRRSL